jgi:hypothetical protein
VVVVPGNGHDLDAALDEVLNAALKGPVGLIHLVLRVDDVAGEHRCIDLAVQRRLYEPVPDAPHRELIVFDRHAGGAAAEVHVAGAKELKGLF